MHFMHNSVYSLRLEVTNLRYDLIVYFNKKKFNYKLFFSKKLR